MPDTPLPAWDCAGSGGGSFLPRLLPPLHNGAMTPSGGRARRPPRPRHTTCSARGHPVRRRRRLCLRRPPPGPGSPLPRLRAARRGRTQLPLPAGRARRRPIRPLPAAPPPRRAPQPFPPRPLLGRRLPPRDGAALAPGAARRGGLPGPGPPPPASYLEPLLGRYATRPAALPRFSSAPQLLGSF